MQKEGLVFLFLTSESLGLIPLFVSFFFVFIFRINAVSNGQVRGDTYGEGCLGRTGTFF